MENARNIYLKYEPLFRRRDPSANKGSYGKLLIAGGSCGMAGAAFLSGLAAFRTGVGMVRFCGPSCNREILQMLLPEAMYTCMDILCDAERPEAERGSGPESVPDASAAEAALDWADMLILGPGLSVSAEAQRRMEFFGQLAAKRQPALLLIDADGLNLIAAHHMEQIFYQGSNVILTPHAGEMARLTASDVASVKKNSVKTASEYAVRYGVTVVLKDSSTVIAGADGRTAVMDSGSAALSKAGSGDVLAGTIAGTAAVLMEKKGKNVPAFDAAAAGVYLHGTAGARAAEQFGENGILARDITRWLGKP